MMPRLSWLPARALWNSTTVGLASASFCRIVSAESNAFSASAGFPVVAQHGADVGVRSRQLSLVNR